MMSEQDEINIMNFFIKQNLIDLQGTDWVD
jgi:hypothetical protein